MNTTNKDYFTFNVHNSALVVGQTGSGKTELVRQYMRRLEQAYTSEQMKYVIYDLKQVEFDPAWEGGAKKEYLYTNIRMGTSEDMDYLEELARLSSERATDNVTLPLLFIYIEECDMVVFYKDRFYSAVKTINKNAEKANMKLIFSTSRPSRDVVPEDFIQSFGLVLAGRLTSEIDEETVGTLGATELIDHAFIVREI